MKEYTIIYEGYAYSTGTVKADSLDEAYEKARQGEAEISDSFSHPEYWEIIRIEDRESGEEMEVL